MPRPQALLRVSDWDDDTPLECLSGALHLSRNLPPRKNQIRGERGGEALGCFRGTGPWKSPRLQPETLLRSKLRCGAMQHVSWGSGSNTQAVEHSLSHSMRVLSLLTQRRLSCWNSPSANRPPAVMAMTWLCAVSALPLATVTLAWFCIRASVEHLRPAVFTTGPLLPSAELRWP